MRSKKINLILHDGTPYGVKTAELSNWNGKVIISSRSAIKKLKDLSESELPAVYFLLGEDNRVYVGETDSLSSRLAHHALKKEFWKDLVAVSSPELSKTEVKYLEHIFSQRLEDDGKVVLENVTQPKAPTMRPEMKDVMEEFVDNVSDILIALGFDFIGASVEVEQNALNGVEVYCNGPDAEAVGVWSENGVVVKQGSKARTLEVESMHQGYLKQRETMKKTGLFVEDGKQMVLQKDHLFSSPSGAAAVFLGRSANGLLEWKNKEGKTIKELEQE